ncbi:hypothetical protein [Streptomyces olivaceoviridis]
MAEEDAGRVEQVLAKAGATGDIGWIPAVLGRGTNHLPVGYDRRL